MSILTIKKYGVTRLSLRSDARLTTFKEDVEFIMSRDPKDQYKSYEFDNKSDRDAKAKELEDAGYHTNKYNLL